ncbi:MAG: DUF4080 domain-containing protein [Thermodesulfobacteriota bacterium]
MRVKLVAINGRYTHSSLALFHVRNELAGHCPDILTEILQLTIRDPYYEVLLRLTRDEPDALFFSAYVWNSDRVEELIRDLHTLHPSCLLVVGGPQAEVVGRNLGQGICTVVNGAVEGLAEGFYRDLRQGELGPHYGRSFFHLAGKRKKFVSPYREEDFATHLANRNIYYESSRGCPFSCTYCLSSAESGIVRKELEQVGRELDQIMAHSPRVLRFVDRTFNDIPERALAIWQLLLGYDSSCLFHFEIAPERFNEEMFHFLATVPPGRFQFEIGIQSTHEPTLDAINRRIDPQVAHQTLSQLATINTVHLHADLILGLPYETEESYLKSFSDLFAMGPHYIQMGLLKMLPDTPLSNDSDRFDYRFCSRPPYAVLANNWLSAPRMQYLYWFSECVEKFYNNRYFPSVWRYLRRRGEDVSEFFRQLLTVAEGQQLFQLAVTQEFLCRILTDMVRKRADSLVMEQLLAYDWLRCGHRTLPHCLEPHWQERARSLKDRLHAELPLESPGLYGRSERNLFLKRSVFAEFSADCLLELGHQGVAAQGENGCLVFFQEREKSPMGCNRVAFLSHPPPA